MNIKSTILLVLLAVGAGVWLWKGDTWVPNFGKRTATADPATLVATEADITPATITRIELLPPSGDSTLFTKQGDTWQQPGNWPLRTVEVQELIDTIGHLRTRFQPIAVTDADFAAYGLADSQTPFKVIVKANDKDYTLRIGEAPLQPGETPFTRPAYARVNDDNEVLKLGPDVMPVLRRPAESYRRRQLFAENERVKFAGIAPPAIPGAPPQEPGLPTVIAVPDSNIVEIRLANNSPAIFGLTPWPTSRVITLKRTAPTPTPTVTERNAEPTVQLARLAETWAMEHPVRDRVDGAKLQEILAALPDLWVEDFVPTQDPCHAQQPFALARQLLVPLEPVVVAVARFHPDIVANTREELNKSKQSVTVKRKDGTTVTMRFGGVAKVTEREEQITIPAQQPGMPPRTITRKVPTTFRYAQIEGNPQLFTVPSEKLDALFVKASELVETNVARFATDEVQTVTIATPGKPPLVFTKEKGNSDAENEDNKQDRWLIEQKENAILAERGRVEELISRLANSRGDPHADLYNADPKSRGIDPATSTTITIVAREKRPQGAPDAPAREYRILLGNVDYATGKLAMQLAGWPRISLVGDTLPAMPDAWLTAKLFPERVSAMFTRPAMTYRSRKLLNTAKAKLTGITVDGASAFSLKQTTDASNPAWKLTTPVVTETDAAAVAGLLAQFNGLLATEFIAEKPANVAEYGLEKPKYTVVLAFDTGTNYTLEIGSARLGKPNEVFARLDRGDVFGLSTALPDSLATGALALLPLQVWNIPPDTITTAEIQRFDTPSDSFALVKDNGNWKLTSPYAVAVPTLNALPVLGALSSLTASKYEALAAPDAAKFGFDKPLAKVKLTYTAKTGDKETNATKTILVGGVTPGGIDRFAKFDEPNAPVFVISGQYVYSVQTSPLTLLDRNILSLNASKIAKVQTASDKPENTVTLTKDDKGVWRAEGAAFTVDSIVAGQLASALAPLPVERLAAYGDAVKWADYGLEKPEVTLTITLSGDKPETHKVQIGKSDGVGGRFVRVNDGKAVAVVPVFAVAMLTRSKLEFADRSLFTFKPEDLLGFVRTKGKEEFELAPAATTGWDVLKPAKQKADSPLMDELAESLARLRAEKVAAFGNKAELFKQYGLEPPEAVVTLTIGEKAEQKVLRLGRPVDPAKPDGDRYAAIETPANEVAVAVLPGTLTSKLLASAVSFRDRTISKFVDADKLQLERGERKVTFSKVNGTWKVTAPLTTDAEQAALDDLVNEFAKLRASDWVAEKATDLKPFGLDNPEAVWTVSNGDKVVLTLRVGKASADGRVYASAGTGGMVALLGNAQSAKVLAEYRVRKPWSIDAFQADTIEFTRGDKAFALQKRGAAWVDPAVPGDAISAPAIAELLGSLTALQVERYAVDENADPKLFGLEKPELTLTITFKDGTKRTLAIGNAVGGTNDKQRYARIVDKSRTEVFVLSAIDTTRLTRDRAIYIQKK